MSVLLPCEMNFLKACLAESMALSNFCIVIPTDIMISRVNPEKALRNLGWKASCKMEEVVSLLVEAEMEAI